jgi:uncharacterized protein YxeA
MKSFFVEIFFVALIFFGGLLVFQQIYSKKSSSFIKEKKVLSTTEQKINSSEQAKGKKSIKFKMKGSPKDLENAKSLKYPEDPQNPQNIVQSQHSPKPSSSEEGFYFVILEDSSKTIVTEPALQGVQGSKGDSHSINTGDSYGVKADKRDLQKSPDLDDSSFWMISLRSKERIQNQVKVMIVSKTFEVLKERPVRRTLFLYPQKNTVVLSPQALGLPYGFYEITIYSGDKKLFSRHKNFGIELKEYKDKQPHFQVLQKRNRQEEKEKLKERAQALLETLSIYEGVLGNYIGDKIRVQMKSKLEKPSLWSQVRLSYSENTGFFYPKIWQNLDNQRKKIAIMIAEKRRSPSSDEETKQIRQNIKKMIQSMEKSQ